MFRLKRPCKTCPFRRSTGHTFNFSRTRLREIIDAPAFQCHGTVDYDGPDYEGSAGDNPQQCAGLMALLHRERIPNQIMQVASRIDNFDASKIEADDVYLTIVETVAAHEKMQPPT